jgi:tetratricopeptide (TPR) repeat protein
MSNAKRPPRPKGSDAARRGAPGRSATDGAKHAGSGGHGKGSTRGGKVDRGAGGHGGSGRFEAKDGSHRKRKPHADPGGKTRSTESERSGGRSNASARGRGTSARGSSTGAPKRYSGGSKAKSSDAQRNRSRGVRRDAQPRWDRSHRAEPSSSHQRPSRGTEQRAGGAGHRGPRDPLIEEIRAATPKAKQEAAIAAFEHARDLLQRGRDGAAADAAADAKRLAPRSGAVRELYGVALYRAGRYRDALRELQAYRRMTGRLDQNHLIADSYRGLGMPDKAVPVAVEAVRSRLRDEPRAEAAIVGASALADLGRFDEALGLLRGFPGRRDEADPWEIRVWYVAGDVLMRAGRPSEAAEEFRRVLRYDAGAFDAAERLAALAG